MKFTLRQDDEYRTAVNVKFHLTKGDFLDIICHYLSTYGSPDKYTKKYTKKEFNNIIQRQLRDYGAYHYNWDQYLDHDEREKVKSQGKMIIKKLYPDWK